MNVGNSGGILLSCITESGITGISFGIERRGSGVGKAWKASVPGMGLGEYSMVALAAASAEIVLSADSSILEARLRNGTQSLCSFAIGGLRSLTSER